MEDNEISSLNASLTVINGTTSFILWDLPYRPRFIMLVVTRPELIKFTNDLCYTALSQRFLL